VSKWERVNIPDVLYFQEGPGVRNTQYRSYGIKLLNVANLQEGEIDLSTSERYISEDEAYGRYKHFLAEEGDLVIASSGIKVEYFDKKMGFIKKEHLPLCMNTSTIRFRSINEEQLSLRFFMYYLKTNSFKRQLGKLITGTAQLNFGPSHLRRINIPLPPLETQKQIAKTLDAASELLSMRKQQLAELDNLSKSVFYDMFGDPAINEKGWNTGTIRDIVSEVKYGTSKPANEKGKYTYLRMGNITYEGDMDYSDIKYIDLPEHEAEKYSVRKGDVLFNRTNSKELVGKTALFKNDTPMIIAGYIIRIRVNEKANPEFLSAILNSKYGKETLFGMCKAIIGQANINAQELQDISIFIPPINLQKQFANIITKIEAQKSLVKKAIEETQLLFDSLMSQYFD
jgi:type I restriction enzyme S subunit